jgi:hypothetical protein
MVATADVVAFPKPKRQRSAPMAAPILKDNDVSRGAAPEHQGLIDDRPGEESVRGHLVAPGDDVPAVADEDR